MLGQSVTLPHSFVANFQEAVYQYKVPILSTVTANYLFLNQRKRIIIFPRKNVPDTRIHRETAAFEGDTLQERGEI